LFRWIFKVDVVPAYRMETTVALTNRVPTTVVRGAGRPQAVFAMERLLDRVARELKIDRAELRARNTIQPDQMPYSPGLIFRDGKPMVYASGDFPKSQRRAIELAKYESFRARQSKARTEGRYLGIGIGNYVEGTGLGPFEGVTIRIMPNGKVAVATGATTQGQGTRTTLSQIVADHLGCRIEDIVMSAGDTGTISQGIGAFASRQAINAAETLKAHRNRLSQEIAGMKKSGQDATQLMADTKDMRVQIQELEKAAEEYDTRLNEVLVGNPFEVEFVTINSIIDKLRAKARQTPPGTWVEGFFFDDTKVKDQRELNRKDLDEVSLDHPVVVRHRGGLHGRLIGVEVTGAYRDSVPHGGSPTVAAERQRSTFLSRVADDYYRAGGPPAHVQFLFSREFQDHESIRVANLLRAAVPERSMERADGEIEDRHSLSADFWILRLPDEAGEYRRWIPVNNQVGFGKPVSADFFAERVARKAERLEGYRHAASEIVLLIHVEGMHASGFLHLELDPMVLSDTGGFDAVYLYTHPGRVHRLA
jgi:hypothetical protein